LLKKQQNLSVDHNLPFCYNSYIVTNKESAMPVTDNGNAYYTGEDAEGRLDTRVFDYKVNPKLDAYANFERCVDQYFDGASDDTGFPCSRDLATKLGVTTSEIDEWLCGC
jgi:hypothetical protein